MNRSHHQTQSVEPSFDDPRPALAVRPPGVERDPPHGSKETPITKLHLALTGSESGGGGHATAFNDAQIGPANHDALGTISQGDIAP